MFNAHCHLELGPTKGWPIQDFSSYGGNFAQWISQVMTFRRSSRYNPIKAVQDGLAMSVKYGVTCLADIYQTAVPLETYLTATASTQNRLPNPLRCVVQKEVICWRTAQIEETMAAVHSFLREISPFRTASVGSSSLFPGLAPHAPHTIHPAMLAELVRLSRTEKIPLAFHLAESSAEMHLMETQSGELREMMMAIDPLYNVAEVVLRSPLEYLRLLSGAFHTFVIHGNYLDGSAVRFLAEHSYRFTVVYCPQSNRYFRHKLPPLETLLDSGVNVAIGSDSAASGGTLDIHQILQLVKELHPTVSPYSSCLTTIPIDWFGSG